LFDWRAAMDTAYIHIHTLDEIEKHLEKTKLPILLIVKKGPENSGFYGKVFRDIFGSIYGDETRGLVRIIENFIRYESVAGRTPLVFILNDAMINESDRRFKNEGEDWPVHTTDENALDSIVKSGKLMSRVELDKQKIKYLDFGRETLNEPLDYYDLIEFADMEAQAEIIVASKEKRKFAGENEIYNPGGRIYIKREALTKQDGYLEFLNHYCIKGTLILENVEHYMLTKKDFEVRAWTPKEFLEAANELFKRQRRAC
jgi:hypothetical protein